ncbi:MAG: SDR family NAD(P)-dependent oxidoreductase [Cyanobacteria bacterium P01_F01_bin.4]
MPLLSEISDLRALVVGASQGIGLGFVRTLLQMPRVTQVFATYRTPESAADLLSLAAEHPTRLHCLTMDVTDEAQIVAGLSKLQNATDRLHVVINCVGFLHAEGIKPEKSLRQIETEQLLRYFQVNSISAILLAKHLMPLLNHPERNLFATLSAKIGSIDDNRLGGWYGYRASKAALNMLLKTAAIEYRRKSKQTMIVMLHPGTTDTQLSQPFQRGVPPDKLFSVERTVNQLMQVLAQVNLSDTGSFWSWDGTRLPW